MPADENAELIAHAREAAARGDDLFELLGLDATVTDKAEIHRMWRRRSLKYHPDQNKDNFDPAKWESLMRARDVLSDPAAREAYSGTIRAALQKRQHDDMMSAKRRRFKDELEARERGSSGGEGGGAKRARVDTEAGRQTAAWKADLLRRGQQRQAERERLAREAEDQRRREDARTEPVMPEEEPVLAQPDGERRRSPERKQKPAPSAAAAAKTPEPEQEPESGLPAGDEYDERIAEIERKLREKAARKAERKARKSGVSLAPSSPQKPQTPSSNDRAEPQADEHNKGAAAPPAAPPASSSSTPSRVVPVGASTPGGKTDFASMMARLKAAQAERDAKKQAEPAP